MGCEKRSWRFMGVYGFLEGVNKWRTWRLLEHLSDVNSLSWMYIGNSNEILYDHEK